ncbi:hypothetical protein ACTHRW_12085 [Bacillus velezensis]|uniref:hypothetical protein n=1 Tax=Bacillus velezensis TaxID=492670 RepID=UPI003AB2F555
MEGTWACLIPFILVIPISIITKQVQSGLFIGLLVGSYLLHPSLLGGIEHMVQYVISNIVVTNNIRIIVFLYSFAGLVGIIKLTGGIKGFVHLISKKVKTKKGAMLLAWLSTFGTFSEPDFRIVTIAPIMKALSKRLDLSKQKIAYAIEFTANPVIALIPIATAFVGYMVSIIGQALKRSGIDQPAYTVYVKSIPFNFFSIVIILVGIYYCFFKKQKADESLKKTEKSGQTSARKHNIAKIRNRFRGTAVCCFQKAQVHSTWKQGRSQIFTVDIRECSKVMRMLTSRRSWIRRTVLILRKHRFGLGI